jgi:mitochondrial import receptor subunit TOM70
LEAATVFTEAIDFILERTTTTTPEIGTTAKDLPLTKQLVTLLNNRSAMYEKANILELSLDDCCTILERDVEHNKARLRKLRILELLQRYNDALIEVCCIQLLFMQSNRINLRMGLPLPPPPVSQSKMEELLAQVLPTEMSSFLTALEEKRKGTKNNKLGQPLPSPFTILQLLRSYTGYNLWMSSAAKNGTIDKLTSDIPVTLSTDNDIAIKAMVLFKRGCRYVYERKYDLASQDFEDAYLLVDDKDTVQALMTQQSTTVDSTSATTNTENIYARLLEWTGMVRHWHYELDSAIECYKKCSTIEPDNPILLVKQAGVQLDATNHDTALELFEQALTIDVNCVDALLHRSNLHLMQSKTQLAQSDLEQCIKIRPNYVMARLRLATIIATTDGDAAMKQLDLAEYSDPISSEVQSYRGEVYFAQGDMDKAVEQFEKAIKLEPQNPTPYVNAAMAILNTPLSPSNSIPDTTRVITLLETAVSIDPQFTAAYIHLGQIKLGTAQNLSAAKDVIDLYNRALDNCRTPEEVKELCGMRTLAIAQVEAATQLNMESFNGV